MSASIATERSMQNSIQYHCSGFSGKRGQNTDMDATASNIPVLASRTKGAVATKAASAIQFVSKGVGAAWVCWACLGAVRYLPWLFLSCLLKNFLTASIAYRHVCTDRANSR